MSNPVIEKWNELKIIIESIDLDIHKNANGNISAGIRARKGLRLLRQKSTELVKYTVECDKKKKEEKKNL